MSQNGFTGLVFQLPGIISKDQKSLEYSHIFQLKKPMVLQDVLVDIRMKSVFLMMRKRDAWQSVIRIRRRMNSYFCL